MNGAARSATGKIRRGGFPMRSVWFPCDPTHKRAAWHMIFMCSREGLVGEPNWALPPGMWVGHQRYVVSTDKVKVEEGFWSFFFVFLFFDIEPENGFAHQLGVLPLWEGAIYKYVCM